MQITKNIHALKIPFKVNISPEKIAERFVYVYIVCGKKIWLIDTGVAGSKKLIFDYIESIGKSICDIESIFLTHSHPDHVGSAKSIKQECGSKVYVHNLERNWVEDVDLQCAQRPVPGFKNLVEGSVKVDGVLKDGDIINLDENLSLRVIHTPGHSNGSVAYLIKEEGALFCGDAVLSSNQMPVFDDLAESINSVKKLDKISGAVILLSSWDDPRKGGQIHDVFEDSVNYFTKIQQAVQEVATKENTSDSMEFCKDIISELKLPPVMANPVTARTFQPFLKKKQCICPNKIIQQ